MSETFECGDSGALVAYLYEECEPEMRKEIAGHLTQCESCSSEIDGLGWTRQRLEVWTPPMSALGFQLPVPAQARLPWWRAPLPAWAQAVAALLIFGVGLSVGLTRGPAASPQVAATQPAVTPSVDTASRAELSQLEQRLKSEMAALRTTASTPVRQTAGPSDARERRHPEEGRGARGAERRTAAARVHAAQRRTRARLRGPTTDRHGIGSRDSRTVSGCDRHRDTAAARGHRQNQ